MSLLCRGLTNAAFVEYLEADERMAPLAADQRGIILSDRESATGAFGCVHETCASYRLFLYSCSSIQRVDEVVGQVRGHPLPPYPLRGSPKGGYPLPPYPKSPAATLPYPPAVPNPECFQTYYS